MEKVVKLIWKGEDMAKAANRLIANNKKARHDYFIEDTYETGIVLHGTEVKSLRQGKCSIKESFIRIEDGEVIIYGMHISPYEKGNIFNKDPLRPKKLMMHKYEINKLVGKIKENFYRDAIAEYSKRLSRYCKLNIVEVADEKTIENSSDTEINLIKEKEAERILKHVPDNAYVITLEILGKQLDSVELSKKINSLGITGESHIIFIIGGSLGLHESVSKRSDFKLSFSKMTFPHQLMRVILLEQIYRSYRIINNEPYHK